MQLAKLTATVLQFGGNKSADTESQIPWPDPWNEEAPSGDDELSELANGLFPKALTDE